MPIPDYQTLMLPFLRAVAKKGGETSIAAVFDEIADEFKLLPEDRTALTPAGGQSLLANRLHWAKTYMQKAGLLASTRHGYFKIADRGQKLLNDRPTKIDNGLLARFPEFVEWKSRTRSGKELVTEATDTVQSPDDQIATNVEHLNKELSDELITRVHSFPAGFFERLILDLLIAMGYGGGRAEMARSLGRSGDGGVDGVVKEDELGLDVVYVQAKRYANPVPVEEVRGFVGSLEGHRASKGIFVTTSHFPSSAERFVQQVSKRVVLIDGPELARLMIKHNVGVRIKETYEIKKIDEDYFVE